MISFLVSFLSNGEIKFAARIKKSGKGSIGITIPKPIAEAYELKPGEYVIVTIQRIEKKQE